VTSVKVRTLLENTFENTVTVIVKVIIEEVREFLIPANTKLLLKHILKYYKTYQSFTNLNGFFCFFYARKRKKKIIIWEQTNTIIKIRIFF
jgi:hypothetical protein